MRVAVIGGGPGGLYFAALARQLAPTWDITVWERNAADETFGFGVVFSDETLDGIADADPAVHTALSAEFARWTDIDVRYQGRTLTSGGHGFAAIGRMRLLEILQQRCAELGVTLRHKTEAPDIGRLAAGHDLVVAADGVHSAVRDHHAAAFRPTLDERHCRYMWLATDRVLDAFTFAVDRHDFGTLQVHAYPYSAERSTVIVELAEPAWRNAGFADLAATAPPAGDDHAGVARVTELLAPLLDGHRLIANNSRWIRFTTVRNAAWRHRNIVLLGDAAHTAHFSIGSGTKLAMEDALALAGCLHENTSLDDALAAYEAERKPVVASTQRAAQASLEWFESIGHYTRQAPEQFAFNLITRSRRVTYGNLRSRDPEFVGGVDNWFAAETGREAEAEAEAEVAAEVEVPARIDVGDGGGAAGAVPPMFHPYRLGSRTLHNRIVVPPMTTSTAENGAPGGFERAHLTALALGGAGLVFAGMTAVSATGLPGPGSAGLYTDTHEASWRALVRDLRGSTRAALGIQLTHAGRRASRTDPAPDGTTRPLRPSEAWPTVAASAVPWDSDSAVPRSATAAELDDIRDRFAESARRADRAGFDVLELQCGHGHLLSSFLSPLTNQRRDAYGGDLAGRLRYPLQVVTAVRAAWPAAKPLVVRISATDWADGGTTPGDAARIAEAFAAAGADAIDVSGGEVVAHERPAYGRSYLTPFADLIRNTTRVPVIAVGGISTYDDANTILLAGRADLCAVGRAHLHDPLWTLHAATAQDYTGPGAPWPAAWEAGRAAPPGPRGDRVPPRLRLLREPPAAAVPRRRRPGTAPS